MKTTMLRKPIALALAVLMLMTAFPLLRLSAAAEASWPWLSNSHYCEYVSPGKTTVYLDSSLSTPGASGRAYNAYIAKGDVLKIYEITSDYTYLAYPTSKGEKTGYVRTATIFGVSNPREQVTSQGKVTTYKTPSTGNKSGYVASGDTVFALGSVNGFTVVMYTAVSVSRAYKVAFVQSSDYDSLIANNSPASSRVGSSSQFQVAIRMKSIGRGNLSVDDNTVLALGRTFVGTRSNEQCKGYARNVFYLCFGINVGSTKDNNYELNSVAGVSHVGTVTDMTEQNVRSLFSNARSGDFVQMKRTHGGPHSMIIYYVNNDGIGVFEANVDRKNTISGNYYTWEALCEKNAAMSVYTATDYTLK